MRSDVAGQPGAEIVCSRGGCLRNTVFLCQGEDSFIPFLRFDRRWTFTEDENKHETTFLANECGEPLRKESVPTDGGDPGPGNEVPDPADLRRADPVLPVVTPDRTGASTCMNVVRDVASIRTHRWSGRANRTRPPLRNRRPRSSNESHRGPCRALPGGLDG